MLRRPTLARRLPLALLIVSLLLAADPGPTRAADGFPVCDVAGDQDSPSMTAATDQATWLAWRDGRRSDTITRTDIYVARFDPPTALKGGGAATQSAPFDAATFVADGTVACASGTAGPPIAVATDSGGVLLLWGDARTPRGIYAQRMRADGSLYPGWPADGRLVTADVEELLLAACTDGSGGAYIARMRAPGTPGIQRVAVTRITKTGAFAPGWAEAGVQIGADDLVQGVTLSPDPGGGAVYSIRLFLEAGAADPQYGRAGRITAAGAVSIDVGLPGWRSGSVSPGVVGSNAIADGAGGLFAAWNDAPGPEYYGQRWNSAGVKQWPDSLPAPHMDVLLRDGAGGVYLVGREKQDLTHLSVQRRDAGGGVSAGWSVVSLLLAQPIGLAQVGAIPDPVGLLVFWSEYRGASGGFDIRASLIQADGDLENGWLGGGDPVCDVPGHQTGVVGAAGSDVVAWIDERNSATTKKDLWAKHILGPDGTVGVVPAPAAAGVRIRTVFPNPARAEVRIALVLGTGAPARIDLIDLRGRVVRHRNVDAGPAERTVSLDTRGLASGVYALRVVQRGEAAHARVAVLR